jgi:sec-independent protein translocase protein TatA
MLTTHSSICGPRPDLSPTRTADTLTRMPQGYELLLIVGLVILLFGGSKLPKLARSLGQARKEFETGTRESVEDDKPAKAESKADAPKIETTKIETTEKTDAAE